jgi:hypothetical protein
MMKRGVSNERKRLVMKPITDLWWRYYRTNCENFCTFF